MREQADQIAPPRTLIAEARLAAADTELASHQAAAMISRLADALEIMIRGLDSIARAGWTEGEDNPWQVIECLQDAAEKPLAALPSPLADAWPAQQRRIAARIAERYEEEAP